MAKRHRSRRQVLATLGVSVAGGLAGCSGGGGDGNADGEGEDTATGNGDGPANPEGGDDQSTTADGRDGETQTVQSGSVESGSLPPYANLLPALDGGALSFTVFGTESEDGHEIGATPENPSDPLRFDGLAGALGGRALASFLLGTEFGFEVDRLGIDETKRILGVAGVGVQVLPVAFEAALSDLEGSDVEMRLEESDRVVYVGPQDDVFGLTGDALVFASSEQRSGPFDPVERVTAVVNARTGAEQPKHATDEAFATLLGYATTGDSVACAYAPGSDLSTYAERAGADAALPSVDLLTDGFGSATGAVFGMDLANGEDPQPATGTITFGSPDDVDDDALTGTVGTAAANRSYVRDGSTVRVAGTYTWEDLSGYERDSGVGVGQG